MSLLNIFPPPRESPHLEKHLFSTFDARFLAPEPAPIVRPGLVRSGRIINGAGFIRSPGAASAQNEVGREGIPKGKTACNGPSLLSPPPAYSAYCTNTYVVMYFTTYVLDEWELYMLHGSFSLSQSLFLCFPFVVYKTVNCPSFEHLSEKRSWSLLFFHDFLKSEKIARRQSRYGLFPLFLPCGLTLLLLSKKNTYLQFPSSLASPPQKKKLPKMHIYKSI